MAKLLIQTQVHENYGAHAWDGQGECPQNWKAKGGEDYVLPGLIVHDGRLLIGGKTALQNLVNSLKPQVEADDHYWRETVVSWEVIGDDELTQWEKDQLEFEGRITCPSKVLTWPEVD